MGKSDLRFLDKKKQEGELIRYSIKKGPYKRKDIPDPNNELTTILEPPSKMSQHNKNHYFADIRVMNYIIQGIPNDIYNSVDACLYAKQMWDRIKRLMQDSEISQQERHSMLMNEFDKFDVEGESLAYVYESASKAEKAARNHDLLALVSNSHVHSLNSHACILELKRRYFEDYCSAIQYAVSIKEDMAYMYLHSPKTTKETRSIRRIQRRPIRHIQVIEGLRKKYRLNLKNDIPPRDK
nr:hypothetical protein [Tanacetum cinerariifolium]